MTKKIPAQPIRDLESIHNHNNYDFRMQGEKNEHLQFQCSSRNVSLELSFGIEVHYTIDTYYLCFMSAAHDGDWAS
jgi:hypothetical protein